MFCKNCNTALKNKRNKYCSKSCAAIINNTLYPKRQLEKQNKCKKCFKKYSRRSDRKTHGVCMGCYKEDLILSYGNKTKKEAMNESLQYAAKHRYEMIRQHGKRLAKIKNWYKDKCEKCGYDKHTELCHVKPIHSFSDESLLYEINAKENIKFLCRNCHWELDNLRV
jgi:hypothetical protein